MESRGRRRRQRCLVSIRTLLTPCDPGRRSPLAWDRAVRREELDGSLPHPDGRLPVEMGVTAIGMGQLPEELGEPPSPPGTLAIKSGATPIRMATSPQLSPGAPRPMGAFLIQMGVPASSIALSPIRMGASPGGMAASPIPLRASPFRRGIAPIRAHASRSASGASPAADSRCAMAGRISSARRQSIATAISDSRSRLSPPGFPADGSRRWLRKARRLLSILRNPRAASPSEVGVALRVEQGSPLAQKLDRHVDPPGVVAVEPLQDQRAAGEMKVPFPAVEAEDPGELDERHLELAAVGGQRGLQLGDPDLQELVLRASLVAYGHNLPIAPSPTSSPVLV